MVKSMFSWIPDFYGMFGSNPFLYGIAALAIGASVGIILGLFLYRFRRTEDHVCYLDPKTMSGYDLPVTRDMARSLNTDEYQDMPKKHFLKYWGSFNIRRGKAQFYRRYLAVAGSVFTATVGNPTGTVMSGYEWVKQTLGDRYLRLPKTVQNILEKSQTELTVQIEKPLPIDKKTGLQMFPDITEDDYMTEAQGEIPLLLGQGLDNLKGRQIIEKLAFAGTGFGIACVLFLLGVFEI